MKKLLLALTFLSSFAFGQKFSIVQKYSTFYNKSLVEFEKFMKSKPTIKDEKFGITTIYYDEDPYTIVVKENSKNNGLIGEITVYSKKDDNAEDVWYEAYGFYSSNPVYKEVNTSFEDKNKNFSTTDLKGVELIKLLRSFVSTKDMSYGMNYNKAGVNYSFFVLDDNNTFYHNIK